MNSPLSLYIYRFSERTVLDPQSFLDQDELLAYSKMGADKRRAEFLHGRFLIKSALTNFHGLKKVSIKKNSNGKPFIKGLKFNLSHSQDFMVLAVSKDYDVGVDIEMSGDKKFFKKVAEQYFSATENKYILSASTPALQQKRFKNLWCLKEAYIKAMSGKLSTHALKISFDLKNGKIENLPTKKPVQFFLNKKMNLAVCAVGKSSLHVHTLKLAKNQELQVQESSIKFIQI